MHHAVDGIGAPSAGWSTPPPRPCSAWCRRGRGRGHARAAVRPQEAGGRGRTDPATVEHGSLSLLIRGTRLPAADPGLLRLAGPGPAVQRLRAAVRRPRDVGRPDLDAVHHLVRRRRSCSRCPSGAWADTVDRRHLLVLSAVVYAGAFSSWLLWPTFAGFALGFVLWGVSGSLMSGTFESLLYDELRGRGRGERVRRPGRARAESAALRGPARRRRPSRCRSCTRAATSWSAGRRWPSPACTPCSPRPSRCRRPRAGPHGGDVVGRTERVLARYPAMLRAGVREASSSVAGAPGGR